VKRLTAAVLSAAVLTALGLGASNVAAADKPSLADDVAARLGITADTLREAFKDALDARVDAAVKAGRLTPEQGAKLKERIANAKGLGRLAFHRAIRHHRGLVRGIQHRAHAPGVIAKYIGIPPKELRSELRSGKSLAQIATAHGKTEDGLVNATLAPVKSRLDRAVQNKRLTQQRADEILARLTDGVKKAVERTPPVRSS
jgi:pyrroline-5-carboxylate reductase